jgi:hypothetical protein
MITIPESSLKRNSVMIKAVGKPPEDLKRIESFSGFESMF